MYIHLLTSASPLSPPIFHMQLMPARITLMEKGGRGLALDRLLHVARELLSQHSKCLILPTMNCKLTSAKLKGGVCWFYDISLTIKWNWTISRATLSMVRSIYSKMIAESANIVSTWPCLTPLAIAPHVHFVWFTLHSSGPDMKVHVSCDLLSAHCAVP